MKKKILLFSLACSLLLLLIYWSCSWKGSSMGQDDRIIVFADSVDWPYYQESLNSVFGKFIRTPVLEREFIVEWIAYSEFENYQDYKNIFFLGRLNSELPVSENIQNLLNEEVIQGVRDGKYFYIPKKDPWAVNQYVLFLVANSRDDMIQKIIDLGDLYYNDFKNYYYQRMKERMFKRMEQEDLEKYIAKHFPFTMRVQHDYFIADENLEKGYVWIRRLHPDRSILVHWLPHPREFQLTSRWVIDERNKLARKIYHGDVIVEEETRAFRTKFKEWTAVQLRGTWRNDSLMIGGPFRNTTFVDTELDRIYMLDYYVQAIGERKKPYLDQLHVIIHTFEVPAKEKRGKKRQAVYPQPEASGS